MVNYTGRPGSSPNLPAHVLVKLIHDQGHLWRKCTIVPGDVPRCIHVKRTCRNGILKKSFKKL